MKIDRYKFPHSNYWLFRRTFWKIPFSAQRRSFVLRTKTVFCVSWEAQRSPPFIDSTATTHHHHYISDTFCESCHPSHSLLVGVVSEHSTHFQETRSGGCNTFIIRHHRQVEPTFPSRRLSSLQTINRGDKTASDNPKLQPSAHKEGVSPTDSSSSSGRFILLCPLSTVLPFSL